MKRWHGVLELGSWSGRTSFSPRLGALDGSVTWTVRASTQPSPVW
jgi:hypothetical protein